MAGMTSRERVLTALQHGTPDRVPYMELFVDEAFGLRLLNRPPAAAPPPMSGSTPITVSFFGGHAYEPTELAQALELDGFCMSIQPRIYFLTKVSEGQTYVTGGMIKQRADLALVDLPDPDDERLYDPARQFLARYRSANYAIGCFINLGSDPVVLSMGWDNFSYALYDDPALVDELMDRYTAWYARAVRHICRLGFDFIWAGDDIAFKSGPMISPKVFRNLFLPYWRRVSDAITLPWIFHSDGNIMPVLDDLLGLGMNALNPIEPDCMDIVDLRRRVGTAVTLVGNIDINLLSLGTPEEVTARTRQTIEAVAPNGSFILASGNSIPGYCAVANVQAMVQACRRYGRYPFRTTINPARDKEDA